MVAVNPGGGQIAQPLQMRRGGGNVSGMGCKHLVTRIIGGDRDQHMAGARQRVGQGRSGPDHRLNALRCQHRRAFGGSGGADDRPAHRLQQPGKGLRAIAVSERKKRVGHCRNYPVPGLWVQARLQDTVTGERP